MALDENKRKRIMDFSFSKFTTMGIPHITMDEISRGVGIGKGTLYQYFPSKEILLFETINYVSTCLENKINDIMSNEHISTIDKLGLVFKAIGERLSFINPSAVTYIERNMPEAYDKIVEIRRRIIMTNLLKLFEEGKRSGLFEPDMDEYLVAHIIIGAANHITDANILSTLNYNLDNLFHSIISTILKGCLTEEGRKNTFQANDTDEKQI